MIPKNSMGDSEVKSGFLPSEIRFNRSTHLVTFLNTTYYYKCLAVHTVRYSLVVQYTVYKLMRIGQAEACTPPLFA
jgi:hypothetical protein